MKLNARDEKQRGDYMCVFEKNVLKRAKMEENKKKRLEDQLIDKEYTIEEKRQKKVAI